MLSPDWSNTNLLLVAPALDAWAAAYVLPREIVYGLISQESRFNPNAVGDSGRAHGLTQIWLTTAQGMGFQGTDADLMNPDTNLQYGLGYLRQLWTRFGSLDVALSAYNGGYRNGTITNPAYVQAVHDRADYFAALWATQDNAAEDAGLPPLATVEDSTDLTPVVGVVVTVIAAWLAFRLWRG